jgi:xylose isomerase
MDINHKLGGQNHVFWGGREGYQSLLNTDMKQELQQMAQMLNMVVQYKEDKGYTAQLLIEPKPREPCKHQYDYDAATTMAFLYTHNLQSHFKLNIEPNHTTLAGHEATHDIILASVHNMLGSIDSNTGDTLLGWDTDQFPMNIQDTTTIMSTLIKQNGWTNSGSGRGGGLNFDCKVRRESVDPVDLFIGHVGAMDCYAAGLRCAAKMHMDGILSTMLHTRYETWHQGENDDDDIAGRIMKGAATLQDCTEHALALGSEPPQSSGKQENYEMIRNRYLYAVPKPNSTP